MGTAVDDTDPRGVAGPFGAIVFWHSLEHLYHAGDALECAASMLGPGGVLIVAMPNAESLQARVFGDRWFALDTPRHRVHVPASALRMRLEQSGLRIDRTSFLRGGQVVFGWLHGLVGSLPGDLDLYDAIRRPAARQRSISPLQQAMALAAGALLLPFAGALALAEAALQRGGTVYMEARRD